MSKKRQSRRKFLRQAKNLGVAATTLTALDQLFGLYVNKAVANVTATNSYPFRYINFLSPGAPPRWLFDQPLNPSGQSEDFIPGGFGSELVLDPSHAAGVRPVYKTYPVQVGSETIHMPPVWNVENKRYSKLLENALLVRGLDMEINNHGVNQQRTVRPSTANPSMTGVVADRSLLPVGAIGASNISTTMAFSSEKKQAVVDLSQSNPVPGLTAPFMTPYVDNPDGNMAKSLDSMGKYAQGRNLASVGFEDAQNLALDMFNRDLASFQSKWTAMRNKYRALVNKAFSDPFPGVNSDAASIELKSHAFFNSNGQNVGKATLAEALSTITNNTMADAFAISELAMMEDLSASVSVSLGGSTVNRFGSLNIPNDQHRYGVGVSIPVTNLLYRAQLSCLEELVTQLKSKGIYDKTVIHFANEFSRTPRRDGSGSDHGFRGGATSIFSGMIKNPGVVGNVMKGDPSVRVAGTWGEAAPTIPEGSNKRKIVNDDVVATLSTMLEVPNVAVKGASLVRKTLSGDVNVLTDLEKKNV